MTKRCQLCSRDAALQVRLICCGKGDGIVYACSAEHAHKFRDSYIGTKGHERAGIIEEMAR